MAIIFILIIFLIFAYYSVEQGIESIQHTFNNIHYLGGHPLVNASEVKHGTLYVSEKILSFFDTNKNENIFEIPIQQIKNCTIETKESLTGSTIVEIFAWALKKNKQYVRIEFKNDLNEFNNVIFYSSTTPPVAIIKAINETRINLIRNKRFERGEI